MPPAARRGSCDPARSTPPPRRGSGDDRRPLHRCRAVRGRRVARASGQARYLVDRGRIELDGADQTTGLSPRVSDAGCRSTRGTSRSRPNRGASRRRGRAERHDAGGEGPGAEGGEVRRAGMLQQDQPAYAASAVLEYDSESRVAVYTAERPRRRGCGRRHDGPGRPAHVDDATGNLAGKGKVATTLIIEEKDEKTGQVQRSPSIAAPTSSSTRTARARPRTRQRPRVGSPGDLEASRVELFLDRRTTDSSASRRTRRSRCATPRAPSRATASRTPRPRGATSWWVRR